MRYLVVRTEGNTKFARLSLRRQAAPVLFIDAFVMRGLQREQQHRARVRVQVSVPSVQVSPIRVVADGTAPKAVTPLC